MKARILELIINPESIENEDLPLLQEEISVQPYAQSLRALYLLGIKKYNSTEFQKELSTTAAFTTDKKVLYQFINGEKYEAKSLQDEQESVAENIEESPKAIEEISIENTKENTKENTEEGNWLAEIPRKEIPKEVEIDGAVNRILFEGEENFLNEENDLKIDLEATAESGVLVAEKQGDEKIETSKPIIDKEKSPEKFKNDLLSIKSEILATEAENSTELNVDSKNEIIEEEVVENINMPEESSIIKEKLPENKYEIERKKMAEEIERKMSQLKKTTQKLDVIVESEEQNATVNFFHSQEFLIKNETTQNLENELVVDNNLNEKSKDAIEESTGLNFENTSWEPMHEKEKTASRFKKDTLSENVIDETAPEIIPESVVANTEIPALNISFFTPEISSIEKEETIEEPIVELVEEPKEIVKSNIPIFINTWQNWLKIKRPEEVIEENLPIAKETNKLDAIEKFIDNAPKISKFKEDNDYKILEKKDDITHLMTETLANLFWTQKLYSKATNAYKILGEKHPEKLEYYQSKIEEIQASRQK
ncbi:hypothetical protein [Frigoriflavimonas asaccharolytica]|uniref:Uncharacterized protein n=1 Tax=Frigoriflavimonas asaccharolytica TaxID=2735899 RepID=A0A8J8K8Y7_9FLAO|nr:hypothetical protein [Frigoriflavimonas asaccharolytica]NRS93363.1 hypothetical protein [Frigoriflavimonas asaccharolytica]